MNAEALNEAVLGAAGVIEASLGAPGTDPSLAHIPVGTDALVYQLVYSMLLWESSHASAFACLESIRAGVVDFNELRVCSVEEVVALLPKDCPRREERADRLLACLNAVFLREHGLSLGVLNTVSKREARQYLDAIGALPAFVAARIVLVSLGGHALPVDGRILRALGEHGVAMDGADEAEAGSRLERAVRAADSARVYGLLEMFAATLPPVRGKGRSKAARGVASAPSDKNGEIEP